MKQYRMMILAVLLTLVGRTMADNLTLETVKMSAGETKQIAIVLSNSTHKYAAFQFDLVLPEGISIAKNNNGKLIASLNEDRKDDHTLTVQDLGSGSYRLLCFSMTNAEFYGTSGALVNMTLLADKAVGDGKYDGIIKSQVFTETTGDQVKWDDMTFPILISDLIGDVNGDGEVNVADLVAVSNYMAGDEAVSKEKADVNSDGEVNVADLVAISNIMSGNAE